jgi:5-formyltetrahydrofolate cyclo-ligase
MQYTIREAKRALREEARARLKGLGKAARAAASAEARARLAAQPLWQAAQTILFFAPLPDELDVWPLLAPALSAGKQVALPRFVADSDTYEPYLVRDPAADLKAGHFGIREPCGHCSALSGARLDLILVPGVAFDLEGRRLGRGKGYYDKLLAEVRGRTCAVAFDEQVVKTIPTEPHDVCMDCLLTPTLWRELR